MANVMVIGSNSFSGSDFIDLLLRETDHRVIGVSRSPEKSPAFLPYRRRPDSPRFEFHQLDLNLDRQELFGLLTRRRPEYVVNFAAQSEVAPSWDHPDQWFLTNAVAIAALAHFLNGQDWLQRYVHISSPEVYGTCVGVVTEDAPLDPSTPYAASKAAGDLMLFTLVKQFGFPMVMVRSTNVYGAHQQLFKIMPRTVIYLKLGRRIGLHGGGSAIKSYIHIRDVSRGELALMDRGIPGRIYHLSPDQGLSVREVVGTICRMMGRDLDECIEIVAERPGQDRAYVIDSTRARSELGWAPRVALEEGVGGLISWIENDWDLIRNESLQFQYQP